MSTAAPTPSPKSRGTIIKVPDATPGLLVVNGQQKSFTLEGIWHVPSMPAANMPVDVTLDAAGAVTSITGAGAAGKEQMAQLGAAAQDQAKQAADAAKREIGKLSAKMGATNLAATAVLLVAYLFLPALAINSPGAPSVSMYDVLGLAAATFNGAVSGGGFLGFLGLLCCAAPIAVPFWHNPNSKWLNFAPLLIVIVAFFKIHSFTSPSAPSGAAPDSIAAAMASASAGMFSMTFGFYIAALAAAFLAVQCLRQRSA